ncbi:MAG: FAD-dependent oxidoreductase [Chitinophagaceae bacterium]|jgi:glycine/D-amino acid oxidase-like deaminating enzyme
MDLKSGLPYPLIKDGLPFSYPQLDKDISTDVAIMGAGISGALMRYYLLKAGIDCVIVDARTARLGSTSASTSLLQYEIDTPLHKLCEMIGKLNAEKAFHLCNDAITTLGKIADKLNFEEFEYKNSLYFAAFKKDKSFLEKEFEARKNAGFDVSFLEKETIKQKYGIDSPAAILSKHGAQTNAYGFTHKLLQYRKNKSEVFDRSPFTKVKETKSGVELNTEGGYKIKAKKLIYATGYEVTEILKDKIVDLKSTYAIVSEQFNQPDFWEDDVLLWNTADPYLYLRTTFDNRIIVGGRDEDFFDKYKRDKLLPGKSRQLAADFQKLFPDIPFKTEFSWTGTFGSTKDGLPYIGSHPKFPNSYFALGFGGNGITFSVIAAKMITDLISGKKNNDADIFSFNRK